MRAISAHCRATGTPPPPLRFALVGDDEIELVLAAAVADAPIGFTVDGKSWRLSAADAGYLASVPGIGDSPRPWPALVTLGRDDRDRQVLADLESLRLLHLDPAAAFDAEGVLAAMAVELSFSPWADEMILTLVGPRRTAARRRSASTTSPRPTISMGCSTGWSSGRRCSANISPYAVLSEHRIDPDLADPWAPEIVLINRALDEAQRTPVASASSTASPR